MRSLWFLCASERAFVVVRAENFSEALVVLLQLWSAAQRARAFYTWLQSQDELLLNLLRHML